MTLRHALGAAGFALSLAACTTPPAPPMNLPATPATFKEADPRWSAVAPADAQPRGQWWRVFADPALDALVDRSARAGTGIQQAAARLSQARALAQAAGANRLPQAGLSGGVSRQGGPLINAAGADGTLYTASAGLSYEVDLIGRLGRTAEAALQDAQAREALLQSARLITAADLTQNYLALRTLDAERALVRSTSQAQRDTLALTERRLRAGLVPELDVARARAEVATIDADLAGLDRRRADLEHAIAFLAGEAASTFRIEEAAWSAALPNIPPGIPSTVLARRPDVAAAQRAMQAAQLRLGVAHTAWFPTLNLTASGGYASPELGDLFKLSARAWGIGALLALPLFDGGRREAAIKGSEAELELALANYREQMLVAFKDVEDQLSGLRHMADQSAALAQAVEAASRAATISESRYRNGLASQLDLLDARRVELRSRRAVLAVQAQRYQATVGLVRSLGGGWGALPPARAGDAAALATATASR
jgi:multidrug efflux system outer membrane protein